MTTTDSAMIMATDWTEENDTSAFSAMTDPITKSTTTLSIATTAVDSLFGSNSPLIALLWFETIAACITYGLGFIGNLLSLSIFCSMEEFRNVSTGVLFILMTLSNTVHLWTLTTEFLILYNVYIYSNGFVQCQFNYYIQNVSRAISTYLAVTIALDRLVRSEWPLRTRVICTQRNAIKLAIAYVVIFAVLWSFYFLPYVTQIPNTNTCVYTQSAAFYFFLTYIHAPVRAVLVCFIPVVIMAGSNIRMLSNIRQSHRRIAANAIRFDNTTINGVATLSTGVTRGHVSRRMSALDRMLFYMMLANVGTFIVTQIPFHIYSQPNVTTLDSTSKKYARAMLLMWSSIYFGVAFYFYCLASPLFREKLVGTLKKIRCHIPRPIR